MGARRFEYSKLDGAIWGRSLPADAKERRFHVTSVMKERGTLSRWDAVPEKHARK